MKTDLAGVKEIAIKFFEQYQSPVTVKEVMFDDHVWIVEVDTGLVNVKTFEVIVDALTGKILSYTPIDKSNT